MNILRMVMIFGLFLTKGTGQDSIPVTEDLYLTRISDNVYIHTSFYTSEEWGRFSSNGLIYVNAGRAALFDTPISDQVSLDLFHWIEDSLRASIVAFVPNHWHNDCTGGMPFLKKKGTVIYAHAKTAEILNRQNLYVDTAFADSLVLRIGGGKVVCRYLGKAHTADNIVTWIPSEKVLFGGCMVRSLEARSLGNTADADLKEWPGTIGKVLLEFPEAEAVIPGHGMYGDKALLEHTLSLLNE